MTATPASNLPRILLSIYVFGTVGLGVELLLMEHTEGPWQWLPIVMLGASLIPLVAHGMVARHWPLRAFQVCGWLIVAGALLGMWLHFDGKAEFKLELDPSLQGWALIRECLVGHSLPPVLAPGSMMLIGFTGLAWAHARTTLNISSSNQNLNSTDT